MKNFTLFSVIICSLFLFTGCRTKTEPVTPPSSETGTCNQKIYCPNGRSFDAEIWNKNTNTCDPITFAEGNPCITNQ